MEKIGQNNVRGFSMIEVALALAIFALAIVALTQSFVNTLLSLETLDSKTDYQSDLRFVRNQVILEADRDEFEKGGQIETILSGTANWDAEIESTQVSDLFKVVLSIELSPPNEKESVNTIETLYLLRPTWSDPVDRTTLIAENTDRLINGRLSRGL